MFKRIFERQRKAKPPGYDEGWKFFELGKAAAGRFECDKALEYFAKSIAACKNPSPYMDRAAILIKRLRYYEALQDLLEAQKLDRAQSREFVEDLRGEIEAAEAVTFIYRNGTREKLIDDLRRNEDDYVAGKIFCAAFDFNHNKWAAGYGLPSLARYHFYNEIDNWNKFERREAYPDIIGYLKLYPKEFIEQKVDECPDPAAYKMAEFKLHSFLCIYDDETMARLRRTMIYMLHERLLDSDYPGLLGTMTDGRPSVTKDAYEFLNRQIDSKERSENVGPVVIGGLSFDGDITDDKILIQVINKIAGKIWELSPTELDLYRYMVEEADRFSKGGQYERNVLKASGIAPLEYEGEMSKADDFKKNRSALEYLDKDVFPKLERFLGAIRASETRAQIFALVVLREENAVGLLRLRQKYAIHYSNNCSKNGHWDSYDKWSEIIAIIEKAVERRSNGRDGK